MTVCIAVRSNRGKVVVAADSISLTSDGECDTLQESKVWTSGPWVIAAAGSHRAAQIIRADCPLPRRVPKDPMHFLVTDWSDQIRQAFFRRNYVADTKTADCPLEGRLIVAVGRRIFEIAGDLSVLETQRDHTAIGSGAPWAMGALHATSDLPVRTRVAKAMAAAEANSAHVRGPYTLEIAA